jgi:7,8-dihydropterin-6-yl-methyl-4-(beta-D-ribofuranosyl)aminobenzene 5'-phosphate synthase
VGAVTFTVVFDNYKYDPALEAEWGFACLVETEKATVLFDTGADGQMLLRNMSKLGKDLKKIDAVALSHIHGDHTGGLLTLLDTGIRPPVYVPAAFPTTFKDAVRARTDVVEVTEPVEVLSGIHSTGYLTWGSGMNAIVEQALVVQTEEGWVVITGCAHPLVVKMVQRAKESTGGEIALVMGGFHLVNSSTGRIETIIKDLRELGVKKAAPSHCSGDKARKLFAEAFGENYIQSGVGRVIVIGP